MEMFEKDKYLFSGKVKLHDVLGTSACKKEVSLLLKEIRLYGIELGSLVDKGPNYRIKNLCLNLAFFIISNEEYISEFKVKRDISIKKLLKTTDVSRQFLESWRDYIVTYVLIVSNPIYMQIQKYLCIIEKDTESKAVVNFEETSEKNKQYTGIVLKNLKKSLTILTGDGTFINIKNTEKLQGIGIMATGSKKKGIKHYRKFFISAAIILAIGLGVFYYIYSKTVVSIVIKATSPITVEVNSLEKIIDISSPTAKGDVLVESVEAENQNVDEGVYRILSYINDNNMIPKNREVLIVITGSQLKEGKLSKSEKFLKDNSIKGIINNGGTEKRIN